MGNFYSYYSSINFIDFDDMLKYIDKNSIIINTLSDNRQNCLIENTIDYLEEVNIINYYLKNDKNMLIIVYGKNCNDKNVLKKYLQLSELGFKNIYIYNGGLFEWLLLQEIYGNSKFKTTSNELDILKYK